MTKLKKDKSRDYCVICEDNNHPATVASSECSDDYCQEVDSRNPDIN